MDGMPMENGSEIRDPVTQQLSVGEAGHVLRALERLEKLLTTAEAERMSPTHHRLMAEARGLNAAIGIRVMRLGGGAAAVKGEWRRPSRSDEGIFTNVVRD